MNHLQSIHISRTNTRVDITDSTRNFNILLYSHDSWGLGHFRRNLAIARALVEHIQSANVLIITGSPCATQFSLPERCEVIKLPSVGKDSEGCYVPRNLRTSLHDTLTLRRRLLMTTFECFNPDVVIVDHQLTGLLGEALDMVRAARAAGKLTIFGMRDIVDSADVVEQAWSSQECRNALATDYEHICIYGDNNIFDAVSEYPFLQSYRHKISTVGYIASPLDKAMRRPIPSLEQRVLVTVGGGEDGEERVEAYLHALNLAPVGWKSHIITGPLMDDSKVRSCKRMAERSNHSHSIRISRFHRNIPGLLQQADAVVSMAGYNSCTEILQSGKPTVLLPRIRMRHEQRMRAERLAAKGLVQSLCALDPFSLRAAVEKALCLGKIEAEAPDLNGLDNMCELVTRMSGLDPIVPSSLALAGAGLPQRRRMMSSACEHSGYSASPQAESGILI